jgi:hypothetical protein
VRKQKRPQGPLYSLDIVAGDYDQVNSLNALSRFASEPEFGVFASSFLTVCSFWYSFGVVLATEKTSGTELHANADVDKNEVSNTATNFFIRNP